MVKISLAIYGASGHGKVVAQIAEGLGYKNILFIDDGENLHLTFQDFLAQYGHTIPIALGIGDNKIREKIFQDIKASACTIATLIDKSALIATGASIAEGVVIMPAVVVNTEAKIGEGVILNSASVIEHECLISSFSHISPNVSLAGGVCIGERAHLGLGSCVIQNINIGADVIVGAGSVIIKDIESGLVVAGNPAKNTRKH